MVGVDFVMHNTRKTHQSWSIHYTVENRYTAFQSNYSFELKTIYLLEKHYLFIYKVEILHLMNISFKALVRLRSEHASGPFSVIHYTFILISLSVSCQYDVLLEARKSRWRRIACHKNQCVIIISCIYTRCLTHNGCFCCVCLTYYHIQ